MSTTQRVAFELDEPRFKELIVLISELCASDPTYGSVKLNKILYFSDFMAYRELGKPITGATYFKLAEGPAPRRLLAVRRELVEEGRLAIEHRPYFQGVQKRPTVVGQDSQRELFSDDELQIVNGIVDYFHGMSARDVSDISHREPGWILAEDREDIPYETAWLSQDPVDQTDEALARQMADSYFE